MFDKRHKPTSYKRKPGQYNFNIPISANWSDASQRVMVVLETIDSEDLKEGVFLFNRSKRVLTNLLTYTCKHAKTVFDFKRKSAAFCAVNFNNEKFMDKPKDQWPGYRKEFAKRIRALIGELKPTHVLVLGDYAAHSMLPEVEDLPKKRGWVFTEKIEGVKVKICPSLDLVTLYTPKKIETGKDDDDDEDNEGDTKDIYGRANLLFYVSQNLCNGLAGRNLYDLSHIRAKPVLVDTIERFDKLYKKIKRAEVMGLDSETANLTVTANKLNVIQFSFDSTKGYVLPIHHEESPFNQEERAYIEKRLRAFFRAPVGKYPLKYLITQYGMFDLRVLRTELGIPIIQHEVWEITAGEWCLDENRKYLRDSPFNTPHGGLEQIFMYYGNDQYSKSAFGKADRSNSQLTKLSNPDFVKYASLDVQSIFAIHEQQQERARALLVGDKPFLRYFRLLVTRQMSNTVHLLSHMMQRGIAMDAPYLALLKSNQSPLLQVMAGIKKEILGSPEVKKASKIILGQASGQASNKGLYSVQPNVFDLGKYEHKAVLFFKVMNLKHVSVTMKTKQPQIDVKFINAYKREEPLVEKFGKYSKLNKLWSTYVKGWWNKLQGSVDGKSDFRLRPSYGFFDVVTGRLNSFDPSLQQVPTRGKESKYIKRSFAAPKGTLHVKFDYSAHEVRVWSYVALDHDLASVFKVGQKLRQLFRKNPSQELKDRIKREGDIHIINVKRFLQQIVDKSHPLRDAIKSVVFGVIYGKGATALSRDIVTNNTNTVIGKIDDVDAQLKALPDNEKAKRKELLAKKDELLAEKKEIPKKYTKEFAADLIRRLFKDFKAGAKWLEWTKAHAREFYYTFSPIGMRRNLFAIITGIDSIVAAMERRAANSPNQGLASQIGVTTGRLVVLELYKVLMKFGYIDKKTRVMPAEILKAVHDAVYSEVPYEIILIYVHVLQWVATYGVTKYYKDTFGIEFPVEPEIEIEFGATEESAYKWDFSKDNLKECLLLALKDQKAIKRLDEEPEVVLKRIYKVYKNSEVYAYLNKHYPILGVPD